MSAGTPGEPVVTTEDRLLLAESRLALAEERLARVLRVVEALMARLDGAL